MYQSNSSQWRRAIDDDRMPAVNAAIEDLAESLAELETVGAGSGSLFSGDAGIALFFAYAYKHFGRTRYRELSNRFLQKAIDWIESTEQSPGLYQGFTGVAWVAEHLQSVLGETVSSDSLLEVDRSLVRFLQQGASRDSGEYDLLKGVVGIGVYALERRDSVVRQDLLEAVLASLDRWAHRTPEGVCWLSPDGEVQAEIADRYPDGVANLGIAHGLPGVAAFLSQLTRISALSAQASALGVEAMRWFERYEQATNLPSRFPIYVGRRIVRQSGKFKVCWEASRSARLAWCYGDPGIAAVYELMFRLEGGRARVLLADRLAEPLTVETFAGHGDLIGTSICHGTAGVALSLCRVGQRNSRLLHEASRWASHIVQTQRQQSTGFGGFAERSLDTSAGNRSWYWKRSPGFLWAAAGVGLVLLACVSNSPPAWDRVLLFSSALESGD